jgi:nicotinamide phosphoribosyltransferase
MLSDNFILKTDSYKLTHHKMYPEDCEMVYSYLEARKGATHPATLFFGLQPIAMYLAHVRVTMEDVEEAAKIAAIHFGSDKVFNRKGWEYIVKKHGGRLPVRIKAVPEGMVVPVDNVLMTVENTDPECFWLTNVLETILLHVWYPTTVATVSYHMREFFLECAERSSDIGFVDFMLHDFGYRGVSSNMSAAIGGAAHLVSFKGTDTLAAMAAAVDFYKADLNNLAFSVPATEHSVMTAHGPEGEIELIRRLIKEYDEGILSVVIDSYNASELMHTGLRSLKDDILARKPNAIGACKFVCRPDSLRYEHDTPWEQMCDFSNRLSWTFGEEKNSKGYSVINPKVGLLWGDGIEPDGIKEICTKVMDSGYSIDHLVFGMGGGLLQKVNRDTERFAFKCSAQVHDGELKMIQKNPLDKSKASKGGLLKLVEQLNVDGTKEIRTINNKYPLYHDMQPDLLELVYEDGVLHREQTFEEVRTNAQS